MLHRGIAGQSSCHSLTQGIERAMQFRQPADHALFHFENTIRLGSVERSKRHPFRRWLPSMTCRICIGSPRFSVHSSSNPALGPFFAGTSAVLVEVR